MWCPHLQDEEPVVVQVDAFALEQAGDLLDIHALVVHIVVAGVVPVRVWQGIAQHSTGRNKDSYHNQVGRPGGAMLPHPASAYC